MESPPKRMTRARAAAKASESAGKTTRVVTAAGRARAVGTATAGTATAGSKSTAAKRKTRADDNDNEGDDEETTARRALRARPKRGAGTQEGQGNDEAPPARATRGRLAKKPAVESAQAEDTAPAPAKARGRPRKATAAEPGTAAESGTAAELGTAAARKSTRARAATATKAGTATAAASSKPGVRKTVKFQEPGKENMEPSAKAKANEAAAPTGLRGRPARRGGAATAARATTRAAAKASDGDDKRPLSPRKVTQLTVPRDGDSSEDELAAEKAKAAVKPLTMSPIKPPASTRSRMAEAAHDDAEALTRALLDAPAPGASLGATPRRPPSSPLKDSASIRSPAKRMGAVPLPGSTVKASSGCGVEPAGQTPGLRASLLQSAAKRPQSPIRGLMLPPASASKPQQAQSAINKATFQSPAKRALPGFRALTEPRRPRDASSLGGSPTTQPLVRATPAPAHGSRPSQRLLAEEQATESVEEDELLSDPVGSPPFSGRLSAVLPRHVDPVWMNEQAAADDDDDDEMQLLDEALAAAEPAHQAQQEAPAALEPAASEPVCSTDEGDEGVDDDPMALDDIAAEMEESAELPPSDGQGNAMYQLRRQDLDPCHDLDSDSDSEDELPCPVKNISPTPARREAGKDARAVSRDPRRSTLGLTSLAEQFGSWSAASDDEANVDAATDDADCKTAYDHQRGAPEADESPARNGFVEDEMLVHVDLVSESRKLLPQTHGEGEGEELLLDDMMVTDEDMALAQEADDMSVMEPQQIEALVGGQSFDDGLSEASQEYGDENQVPPTDAEPTTPNRPVMQARGFFTTTKVPLKPADESTPSPLKKRSLSASRVTCGRPRGLARSATVISYSPSKDRRESLGAPGDEATAATPARTDVWSATGTPARTPRRDVDPALLRGAVVLVDVHTTEGADASGIFVELLGQMGARCVKTWHWNPCEGESSTTKAGITHVVYKDGGKRTLEKVREAKGMVHCVGVSWVLDCERENEWLDEAPYSIDTGHVPRGGARRRKSMEPKALANLNGAVVSSLAKAPAPYTPTRRRDSAMWVHTPSDEDVGDEDLEWSCVLLTPVPKTPAPEAVARYAAELPETPGDDDVDSSPAKQALVTRTCPPKRSQCREMGEGILGRHKDETVLMRLMAARRKSLQFAPKVGSPLSRTWD